MSISFNAFLGLFKMLAFSLVITLIVSPLAIWFARRVGMMDTPGRAQHKQHDHPVPIAGGLVVFVTAALMLALSGQWNIPFQAWLAVAIIFAFGVWDDLKGLSASQKFFGQIIASGLLISSGISVKFLESLSISFLPIWGVQVLGWGITVFWLVGISNAINLIDSMDGLAVGVAEIAFGFFMLMALAAGQNELAVFCAIFLGICTGLYFFNVTPARLFLGDSGAQTLGFVLSAAAMTYTPQDLPQASSWFVPILVLGFPIFDTTLVVVSRIRRHKNVFQADRSHTYHRLIALGLAPNQAVMAIHLIVFLLALLAFIALSLPPVPANLVFFSALLVGLAVLIVFEVKRMGE